MSTLVKCIDPGKWNLTKGKNYGLIAQDSSYIFINNDKGIESRYSNKLFEFLEDSIIHLHDYLKGIHEMCREGDLSSDIPRRRFFPTVVDMHDSPASCGVAELDDVYRSWASTMYYFYPTGKKNSYTGLNHFKLKTLYITLVANLLAFAFRTEHALVESFENIPLEKWIKDESLSFISFYNNFCANSISSEDDKKGEFAAFYLISVVDKSLPRQLVFDLQSKTEDMITGLTSIERNPNTGNKIYNFFIQGEYFSNFFSK